ncbi:MAG: hypothetical protein HYX65_12640 [Gemmatimonadetes bacterium]|nr:hypothetical protein [Gemmatimonadota bacterium]
MLCREFRAHYAAYLDVAVDAGTMQAMERHAAMCARCSRMDSAVRRGLMLARNLPEITPSARFAARLDARLVAERIAAREEALARKRPPTLRVMGVLAASLVAMGWLAGQRAPASESWRIATSEIAPIPVAEWRPAPALRIRSAPLRDPAVVTVASTSARPQWMASAPVPMSAVSYTPAIVDGQAGTR